MKWKSGEDDPDIFGNNYLKLEESGDERLRDLNVWHKHMIRRQPKDIYNTYAMHDNNDVNDIAKYNLVHDILNTP